MAIDAASLLATVDTNGYDKLSQRGIAECLAYDAGVVTGGSPQACLNLQGAGNPTLIANVTNHSGATCDNIQGVGAPT